MANVKITELPELTAPAAADLLEIVDDVAGTPTSKKVTVGNLKAGLAASGSNSDITSMTGLNDKGIPEAKVIHTRVVVVKCIADDAALTVADGIARFAVPLELNGMNLISVGAHIYTASSSGAVTFQIQNETDSHDMLSTAITVDAGEYDSKDATTAPVINTTYDDVATGDVLRFDCDGIGTGSKGMEIRMGFRLP